MPIYEYQCKACGHEMEVLQKLSDDPLKDCPACKKSELFKKISAAGFRLKGGGWYETDFKSGSDKKKNLASDANTAPASAPAATESSTPAAKTESSASSSTTSTSTTSTSTSSSSAA